MSPPCRIRRFSGEHRIDQPAKPAFWSPIGPDVAPPLGIARLEDWQTTLADMVLAAEDVPFAWGTHDCCMWTADVVKAMSVDGIDLAAPYRGTYSDAAGAADVIADATGGGTLEDLMVMIAAQYTLPEVAPTFAQRGDIALFDTPLPEPPDPVDPTPPIDPDNPPEPPDPEPDQRRRRRARDAESGPAMGIVGPNALTRRFRLARWPGHGRYGQRPPLLADRGRRRDSPSNAASHCRRRRHLANERSDVDRGFRRLGGRHRGAVPGARRRRSAEGRGRRPIADDDRQTGACLLEGDLWPGPRRRRLGLHPHDRQSGHRPEFGAHGRDRPGLP